MFNYRLPQSAELEYVTVATVDELGPGQRKLVDVDGEPVAVFNIAGRYFAIADVCSHDDGPVAKESCSATKSSARGTERASTSRRARRCACRRSSTSRPIPCESSVRTSRSACRPSDTEGRGLVTYVTTD